MKLRTSTGDFTLSLGAAKRLLDTINGCEIAHGYHGPILFPIMENIECEDAQHCRCIELYQRDIGAVCDQIALRLNRAREAWRSEEMEMGSKS